MSERTIASISAAIMLAFPMAILWRRWRADPQNRMVPPLIITVVGSALLVYSYVWAFDVSACTRGRTDYVCGLNQNQGVLTFVTLLIAVIAIWLTLLADENRRREQATSRQRELTTLIRQAAKETNHNLIHMAQETARSGVFKDVPQLSVVYAATLYSPGMAGSFSPALVHYAETLVRLHEMVHRAAAMSLRMPDPEQTPYAGIDEPHIKHPELVQVLENFTTTSIEFLLQACKDHSEALQVFMRRPGRQDFARSLEASAKAMAKNSAMSFDNSYYLVYQSSSAERAAPQLRLQEVPLVCWVEDKAIPKVATYPMGDRYHDMEDSDYDESI